jgi:hypothetical protein
VARVSAGQWLTEERRAGLLAAVATYPLTRLAGTLPRPAFDGAVVSGAAMAVAYGAGFLSSGALRAVGRRAGEDDLRQDLVTTAVATAVAVGAGVVAGRTRLRARRLAEHRERVSVARGTVGSAAEVLAVGAGAAAVVAAADSVGSRFPAHWKPNHQVVATAGIVLAGALAGAAARHSRLVDYLGVPGPDDGVVAEARFLHGSAVAGTIVRSLAVAGATVAGVRLETRGAEAIGRALGGGVEHPSGFLLAAGHAVIVSALGAVGTTGFLFYSSRVEVQEHMLEAAYAAVPSRDGVTGGPRSGYEFTDLGREGRRFVSQAYTGAELEAVLGVPCQDSVRAFLPLDSLSFDPDTDAAALVAEMDRLGAFDRSVIVLASPTGDGYVSYVMCESVELMTRGDCALVAVPYAHLPAVLALPWRRRGEAGYLAYVAAVAREIRERGSAARLVLFGESFGAIVALDAFGPGIVAETTELGVAGGLYVGVPVLTRTNQRIRPSDPGERVSHGIQFVTDREQALVATPGHVNLTHRTDPTSIGDVTTLVRHGRDYWGRPTGVHIPVISFLVNLADVKNAMHLRPGEFTPSPGHDYRYETAAATARAYDLPFDAEEAIEAALRERELAWSVRRLLSRRVQDTRDSVLRKLQSWGVDPASLQERFGAQGVSLPDWLAARLPATDGDGSEDSTVADPM